MPPLAKTRRTPLSKAAPAFAPRSSKRTAKKREDQNAVAKAVSEALSGKVAKTAGKAKKVDEGARAGRSLALEIVVRELMVLTKVDRDKRISFE